MDYKGTAVGAAPSGFTPQNAFQLANAIPIAFVKMYVCRSDRKVSARGMAGAMTRCKEKFLKDALPLLIVKFRDTCHH